MQGLFHPRDKKNMKRYAARAKRVPGVAEMRRIASDDRRLSRRRDPRQRARRGDESVDVGVAGAEGCDEPDESVVGYAARVEAEAGSKQSLADAIGELDEDLVGLDRIA